MIVNWSSAFDFAFKKIYRIDINIDEFKLFFENKGYIMCTINKEEGLSECSDSPSTKWKDMF